MRPLLCQQKDPQCESMKNEKEIQWRKHGLLTAIPLLITAPNVGLADSFSDALTGGKVNLDMRLRYEYVDQGNNLKDANAPHPSTAAFNILFVLVVLSHSRRKVVHFSITSNPTAEWTAQQIVEAFPWDTAQKHLMRDRYAIYGVFFRNRVKNMGIKEVVSAPQSPWQKGYVAYCTS
jgi:hypothetical protein